MEDVHSILDGLPLQTDLQRVDAGRHILGQQVARLGPQPLQEGGDFLLTQTCRSEKSTTTLILSDIPTTHVSGREQGTIKRARQDSSSSSSSSNSSSSSIKDRLSNDCGKQNEIAEECSQVVLADRETLDVPAGAVCLCPHCGGAWTGDWMRRNSTEENLIVRHPVTNVNLSANQTKLILNFLNVHKSDEGSYGCSVTWAQDDTEQGNLKYVNVTAAIPMARQETEVVYADISPDALRQQGVTKKPDQSTVYSSLRFP
ncbi:hypothetical protein F7725_020949 [Dissostichus mawsoni]|uniref:Ig-like domain-containing protein n=1 Tax=Dissostichus mawsoni TaxID=36200 RepID=A0A7J5YFY1_DISMA|nr:hypothetical protein F7725_020949 [Dissostichus mawsoni]